MRKKNHIRFRFLLTVAIAAMALASVIGTLRTQASTDFDQTAKASERPLYLDPTQPLEARVEDLLSRMTLEEKIALLHGDSKFTSAAIPRLGIPRRWMSDGPHGVREDVGPDTWLPAGHTDDFSSLMPAQIGLASTFNTDLARAYGDVIGEEALKRGKNIMLGPGVNIMRTPLNGRNFEYYGEDPYLSSRMAVNYIRAVQSHDVAACVKHFAGNNQEWERGSINVEMDERTLREIYLPAFRAAVQEGGVWSIMGAYNKFRGQHCCHNDYLLNQILKGEWGFQGLVVSDWGGVHDTREAALFGLDLEMGTNRAYDEFYLARPYADGVQKGDYPMSILDDKARRNLRQIIATHTLEGRPAGAINTKEHQQTARRIAEEGIVLLKNESNALPLDPNKITSVAVIGDNAVRLQSPGGGSAGIKAFYEITPLEGILRRIGDRANVTYAAGYRPDGKADVSASAIRAASQADVVIYVGGLNHSRFGDEEGADRKDMKLPYGQDDLLQRIVQANPKTIVVLFGGGPVEMGSWLSQVPAVLQAWYPGMEGGNALAAILFGDVNPSGKLPCTFPKRLEDSPAHSLGAYPGKNGSETYEEGLLVGYRWFDTKNIEPLFPFGYGLSYTKFEYSGFKLVEGKNANEPPVTVQFDVTNTGSRDGAEIAEVYIKDVESSLPRPDKELKGFRKVFLRAGQKQTVVIPLNKRAFEFYDPARKSWIAEAGDFVIQVGSSSRDIRLKGTFKLAPTSQEK